MLNLPVTMYINTRFFLFLTAVLSGMGFFRPEQSLNVDSPQRGDVLQGVVSIVGSTNVAGFQSAEVSFAYGGEGEGGWFLLERLDHTTQKDVLAVWDTTTITDGDYRLRVLVTLENGEQLEKIIEGLRVRNYTPFEVQEEPETAVVEAADQAVTVTPTFVVTATPLPVNPASVTTQRLLNGLVMGALTTGGLFFVLGLYLFLRNLIRR
jgi:hypothetical protein